MEEKYPIGGYAPGNYECKCSTCEKSFIGDKRAVQCEPCAIAAKEKFDALSPEQQMDMIKRNGQIANVLFSTPASPERDLILRIIEQWGNAIEMQKMEQWLKDYAAKNQPGAVWVKASTRTATHGKQVYSKDGSGRKTVGYFTKSNLASDVIDCFYSMVGSFYIKGKDYESLEWYDESAAGREEDAVEFAEWIRKEAYQNAIGIWNNGFQRCEGGKEFTTAQLYKLFKQKKEK